jgi:hypothetical protein
VREKQEAERKAQERQREAERCQHRDRGGMSR